MISKVQVFVLDQNGTPIPNIPLILELALEPERMAPSKPSADWLKTSDDAVVTVTHAILQSDHVGFLSFDLSQYFTDNHDKGSNIRSASLKLLNDRDTSHDITGHLQFSEQSVIVPFTLKEVPATLTTEQKRFSSVQNPSCVDWTTSPNSFGTTDIKVIGDDGCEILLPSAAPNRLDRFHLIIPEPTKEISKLILAKPTENCEIFPQSIDKFLCYRNGRLVQYETEWRPLNHGLGSIINSITLAPCESTNIAVIDWSREDTTRRDEDQELTEHLIHNLRHDRTIEEIIDASIKEWQSGRSFIGGTAGVGGYGGSRSGQSSGSGQGNAGTSAAPSSTSGMPSSFGSLWSVTGSHSLGLGKASTRGEREVEAETTQTIADSISQASDASRRLRGTVVVQSSQSERERLQTRTIRNHNHCHALTILYYEILRHYCVRTSAAKEKNIIFVKYDRLTFSVDDKPTLLKWRPALESVLLDSKLRECFDAADDLMYEPQPTETTPEEAFIHVLRYEVRVGENPADRRNSEFVFFCELTDGTELSNRFEATRHLSNGWMTTKIVQLASPISLTSVLRVGLKFEGAGRRRLADEIDIDRFRVKFVDQNNFIRPLYDSAEDEIIGLPARFKDNEVSYSGPLSLIDTSLDETIQPTLDEVRRSCVVKLVDHLNANQYHYNIAIWLSEDPNERLSRFDKYEYLRGRLSDYVQNEPLVVFGDYLGFAVGEFRNIDKSSVKVVDRVVSLPTHGAFAETQLSKCPACEERDITRYWDWTESPCPDTAPEITGVMPGSRARDDDSSLSDMPSGVVNIVNPPNVPDPSGLSAALQLLATSNIFRDMSTRDQLASVLNELTRAAAGTNSSIVSGLSDMSAAQARQQMAAQQSSASPKQTARDTHDMNQVIRDAVRKGNISPQDGNELMLRNVQRGVVDDPLGVIDAPPHEGIFENPLWVREFIEEDWPTVKAELVRIANEELTNWRDAAGNILDEGHPQVEPHRRLYWTSGVGLAHAPLPNVAWSAAFISYVVRTAGAGAKFVYTAAHINYIQAARQNRVTLNWENPFWLYCPDEVSLEPGDLICRNRGASTFTCTRVGWADSPSTDTHCDIVVRLTGANTVVAIGGNKNTGGSPGTVAEEEYRVSPEGRLLTDADQSNCFGVIKVRTRHGGEIV